MMRISIFVIAILIAHEVNAQEPASYWNAFGGSPSYGQNYLEAFGEQMTEVIPSEQFPAGASTVKFVGKQDYDIQGNRVKFFVPTLNAISYFDDNTIVAR